MATVAPNFGRAGIVIIVPLLLVAKLATGFCTWDVVGMPAGMQVLTVGHE